MYSSPKPVCRLAFGPVPATILTILRDNGTARPAELQAYSILDRRCVGLARTSTLYARADIGMRLPNQRIVVEMRHDGGQFGHGVGDWRPFLGLLRKLTIAYDFVAEADHGADPWRSKRGATECVLERWRPGMRRPHRVACNDKGIPSLDNDAVDRALRTQDAAAEVARLRGDDLGSLFGEPAAAWANAAELAMALGEPVSGIERIGPGA